MGGKSLLQEMFPIPSPVKPVNLSLSFSKPRLVILGFEEGSQRHANGKPGLKGSNCRIEIILGKGRQSRCASSHSENRCLSPDYAQQCFLSRRLPVLKNHRDRINECIKVRHGYFLS